MISIFDLWNNFFLQGSNSLINLKCILMFCVSELAENPRTSVSRGSRTSFKDSQRQQTRHILNKASVTQEDTNSMQAAWSKPSPLPRLPPGQSPCSPHKPSSSISYKPEAR